MLQKHNIQIVPDNLLKAIEGYRLKGNWNETSLQAISTTALGGVNLAKGAFDIRQPPLSGHSKPRLS